MYPQAKPIPFSPDMIQAILDGRKTQTRRIVNFPKDYTGGNVYKNDPFGLKYESNLMGDTVQRIAPRYQPGDYLWVEERFRFHEYFFNLATIEYSNGQMGDIRLSEKDDEKFMAWNPKTRYSWKPPMFMFKTISRITLKVTNVRAERLQDITDTDAEAEGAPNALRPSDLDNMKGLNWTIKRPFREHQFGFLALWCKINGTKSWEENPWVWVYEFKVDQIKVFSESEIDN